MKTIFNLLALLGASCLGMVLAVMGWEILRTVAYVVLWVPHWVSLPIGMVAGCLYGFRQLKALASKDRPV